MATPAMPGLSPTAPRRERRPRNPWTTWTTVQGKFFLPRAEASAAARVTGCSADRVGSIAQGKPQVGACRRVFSLIALSPCGSDTKAWQLFCLAEVERGPRRPGRSCAPNPSPNRRQAGTGAVVEGAGGCLWRSSWCDKVHGHRNPSPPYPRVTTPNGMPAAQAALGTS